MTPDAEIVVVEHEVFYFHFLIIYHHVCRLLVMHHCLRETRRVYADNSGHPWHALAEHGGINLATQWGQEALLLAEGVLAATLSLSSSTPVTSPSTRGGHPDPANSLDPAVQLLNTAPDQIFAMLCFAASFLVMCKLAIHQNHGADLPGSSDILLERMIGLLVKSACAPDHAPAKCAQLISGLVASFEARTRKRDKVVCGSEDRDERGNHLQCNTSAERTSLEMSRSASVSGSGYAGMDTGRDGGGARHLPQVDAGGYNAAAGMAGMMPSAPGDFGRLLNSEVMLDTEFWASFMDNLTTDVPYMEGVRAS